MARSSTDRRTARTQATLQRALTSLTLKKRYDAITVKDICDTADIGRSTFYAHYRGKDDLKRSGMQRHMRELLAIHQRAAQTGEQTPALSFSLTLFEHARDHKDLYRALAGSRGGGLSLGVIRQSLLDSVRSELAANVDKRSDAPSELVVRYVVGAYMAVLTWWLDGGAKLPPARVDAIFRRLTVEGVMPSARD